MAFIRDPGELILSEGEKLIILSMRGKKFIDGGNDASDEIYDDNQIEISYREDDEDGCGIGNDEYITTADITAMAGGIRNVISNNTETFEYHCQDNMIRLNLQYDRRSGSYSITVGILETLLREEHISITKTGLSRAALNELVQPFFEWEKLFPVVAD